MSETTSGAEATATSRARSRRVPAVAVAAIVVAGTAIAVPAVVQSTQAAELAHSREQFEDTKETLAAAAEDYRAHRKVAVDVHVAVDEVLAVVTPAMIDSAGALTALVADGDELKKLLTATTPKEAATTPTGKTAAANRAASDAIDKAAAALTDMAAALQNTTERTITDLRSLVDAAAKAGPSLSFPQAGATEQIALAWAVTGLYATALNTVEDPSDIAAGGRDALVAYASAVNDAVASQDPG
ncbi:MULTISPECIES: hypothetical protein [Bacteria]|uniref:hypothetical protein n=1 Tax=Bacteria TaxID=2 RepID=UPI003C7D199E